MLLLELPDRDELVLMSRGRNLGTTAANLLDHLRRVAHVAISFGNTSALWAMAIAT